MVDFKTYFELLSLYSDYAMVCDSTEWEKWPDFFVDAGTYRLQPRENFEQGLPLCLLALESKAMIQDRVYGERIVCEANYAVIRTKFDGDSTILSAGYYHDEVVRTEQGLKLLSRLCVYDSEMIANSIIYPI
jgi:salicylate 5-hydroxylase small subunit